MKLVFGNAIGHFLPCHHNGWHVQMFKPPSTMSNLGSDTEVLKHSYQQNQFAQKRLHYSIILLARQYANAHNLEWDDHTIIPSIKSNNNFYNQRL